MTASRVLILKLPELHADVKMLEAFRAYVCDALSAGALVLPLGTTYAVEDFPALGAVMVETEEPVPVVLGGPAPTPAGGGGGLVVDGQLVRSVPESGTAEETTPRPEPEATPKAGLSNRTVFRSPEDARKRKASAQRALPMSAGEIVSSYKQAAKPEEQIGILAELNACTADEIRSILVQFGVDLPEAKKRQSGRPRKGSI